MNQESKNILKIYIGDGIDRNFDTPDDFFAVFRKLEERGDFFGLDSLLDYADTKWDAVSYVEDDNFFQWLLSRLPDGTYRLCELTVDAIREGVIG
jgi:hypothetical protein